MKNAKDVRQTIACPSVDRHCGFSQETLDVDDVVISRIQNPVWSNGPLYKHLELPCIGSSDDAYVMSNRMAHLPQDRERSCTLSLTRRELILFRKEVHPVIAKGEFQELLESLIRGLVCHPRVRFAKSLSYGASREVEGNLPALGREFVEPIIVYERDQRVNAKCSKFFQKPLEGLDEVSERHPAKIGEVPVIDRNIKPRAARDAFQRNFNVDRTAFAFLSKCLMGLDASEGRGRLCPSISLTFLWRSVRGLGIHRLHYGATCLLGHVLVFTQKPFDVRAHPGSKEVLFSSWILFVDQIVKFEGI